MGKETNKEKDSSPKETSSKKEEEIVLNEDTDLQTPASEETESQVKKKDTKSEEPPAKKPEKTENFSSDSWEVTAETYPECQIKLIAKSNTEIAQKTRKEALRKLAKEVSIPGFRKGKAPSAILEKKFPQAVQQEWEQAFANVAAIEASALSNKNLSHKEARITFHAVKLDSEGGEILLFFESYPEVPEVNPTEIQIPAKELTCDLTVTDEDVEKEVLRARQFLGEWKKTEKAAKENDFVILDIDDIDQEPPVRAFSDINLKVSKEGMSSWMMDLIIGKSAGDVVEGVSHPDDNASESDKKNFTEKKVKIYIKDVSEAVLPEVNEEFFKKLGLESEEDMRNKVRSLIAEKKEREHKEVLHKTVQDKMVEAFSFDIPHSIWKKETEHRLQLKKQMPELAQKWESLPEKEKKQIQTETEKEAKHALCLFYLTNKMVTDHKLAISEPVDFRKQNKTLLDWMFAPQDALQKKPDDKTMSYAKALISSCCDYVIDAIKNPTKAVENPEEK